MAGKAMWEVDPETRSKVHLFINSSRPQSVVIVLNQRLMLLRNSSSRSKKPMEMTGAATVGRHLRNGLLPNLASSFA
jgi:hypothetical protein